MTTARPGHIVQIHCTTRHLDGKVIESTANSGPIDAELGAGELPAPIEAALIGMSPGEHKTARATPPPPPRQELVFEVRQRDLPEADRLRVGEQVQVNYADGRSRKARITRVGEATATLDANHPLAGHELLFDLRLVSILSEGALHRTLPRGAPGNASPKHANCFDQSAGGGVEEPIVVCGYFPGRRIVTWQVGTA